MNDFSVSFCDFMLLFLQRMSSGRLFFFYGRFVHSFKFFQYILKVFSVIVHVLLPSSPGDEIIVNIHKDKCPHSLLLTFYVKGSDGVQGGENQNPPHTFLKALTRF